MPSYSDLQTYRKCPRLYGFKLLGYTPVETPEAMLCGQLAHTAIAAYFRGTNWADAMVKVERENIERLTRIDDSDKKSKALRALESASRRAEGLAARYIAQWTKDYTAILVETELTLGNVVCHPDLIAYYQEQRVIVDYKTSKSPDIRWYDVSGQVDLYAYVIKAKDIAPRHNYDIALVIYDVISEEGIYRHTRQPRLEIGERLFREVSQLDDKPYSKTFNGLISCPHLAFDCPNRCQFWEPCWLLETADWSACEDYLESNYIKESELARQE